MPDSIFKIILIICALIGAYTNLNKTIAKDTKAKYVQGLVRIIQKIKANFWWFILGIVTPLSLLIYEVNRSGPITRGQIVTLASCIAAFYSNFLLRLFFNTISKIQDRQNRHLLETQARIIAKVENKNYEDILKQL